MPFLTEQDYRYLMPLALYDFYVRKDIYEGPYTKMLLSTKVGRRFLVEQLFSEEEGAGKEEKKSPKPKFTIDELNKTIEALSSAIDHTIVKATDKGGDKATLEKLDEIQQLISDISKLQKEEEVIKGLGEVRVKISEELDGSVRKELLSELDKKMKEFGADKSIFYGLLVKTGLLSKLWGAIKGSAGYLWKLAKKVFDRQTYSKMWNWAKGHKFWSISIIVLFISLVIAGFGTSTGRKVLRFIWRIISWPFRMVYRGIKWVINKITRKEKVPSDVDTLEPSEIPEMA